MTRRLARLWPFALALLIMAPLLAPGYVLAYDMVFVPDQSMRPDYLGLGEGLPRAVPSDALVSIAGLAFSGQLVQKAVLLGLLVLAGVGMARLTRLATPVVTVAAVSWFVWNPYVAERLLIGQWVVLIGYAALPWVAATAIETRRGSRQAAGGLVLAMAVAATSASGGLMAAVVAAPLVFWPGSRASLRQRVFATVGTLAVNAPWVVAGLLHRATVGTSADAVEVFSASGEGRLATLPTVLGLGGIWNSDTVLDSRGGWVAVGWLVLLWVVVIAGIRPMQRRMGSAVATGLGIAAAVSLLLALAGATSSGLVATLADQIPGLALLRDGTRYLGGLALLQALAFGFGAQRLAGRVSDRQVSRVLALGLALTPLAVMPDLAWGAAGRLQPTEFPAEWDQARAAMVADDGSGSVLVLPASPYRAYDWNGSRPVLDPAPRFFPHDMLASDALSVDGALVQPEDRTVARAVTAAHAGDLAELAELGVGYVVVDAELDRLSPELERAEARALYQSGVIDVYAVPAPRDAPAGRSDIALVALAWAAGLGAILAAVRLRLAHSRRNGPRNAQNG